MSQSREESSERHQSSVDRVGDFSEVSFPELLLELCRTRYSGALDLVRDKTAKRIIFQQGAPVLSESNLANETLGMQLMDQGSLSRSDHRRVSAYMESKRCKEGVALLALELLAPKELFLALKEQVRRRMHETFSWSSGSYRLEAVDALDGDVQPLRSDPLVLIREGLVNHWTADRLLADLTEQVERFPQRTKTFDEAQRRLAKDAAIVSLLDRFDGTRTLGAAIGSQFNSPEALATVWILAMGRYVRFSETAPSSRDEEEAASFESEIEIEVVGEKSLPSDSPTKAQSATQGSHPNQRRDGNAADTMRAEVLTRLRKIDDTSHYDLLGVSRDATDGEIRKAYFAAAKRFHPDALTHLGLSDVKQQATVVFARIAEASDVLRDPARRAEYNARSGDDEPAIDTQALVRAETLYRKAEVLVRMGDFRGALEYLEPAVELWPDECEYQSALGWALYKQPQAEAARSLIHLERATALNPGSAVALFRLGMVLRACGDDDRAARCLNTAKQLDPRLS